MRIKNKPILNSKGIANLSEAKKPKIDVYLQRAAWIAQITLFIVAIFGYFLTVRPVYQKQLLDEQIAERTIKLRKAEINLNKLTLEEDRLKKENSHLAQEANINYQKLKHNLFGMLSSASFSCIYSLPVNISNGDKLYNCVSEYVKNNISNFLRAEDKALVDKTIEAYKIEISQLPDKINLGKKQSFKDGGNKLANIKLAIKNNEKNFLSRINGLRKKENKIRIRNIKELGSLEGPMEGNAYIDYRSARESLIFDLLEAEQNLIYLEGDLNSNISAELTKVLEEISQKLE